jgi:sortase A
MRLVITQGALRWILPWTQRALFACAMSMFGYCGFVVVDTWVFQIRERRQLEGLLEARRTASPAAPKELPAAVNGGLIGRIEIPRLGLSVIVVEGTGSTTLRRAAGHISGTALPGKPGNIGISAHRDTLFRPLRNIRRNDIITLTTLLGEFHYRVVSTKVVDPHNVAVLDPTGNEILTLVTCYPFYYVGSAPDRFIVRAERVT